jgi:hypothetical protein
MGIQDTFAEVKLAKVDGFGIFNKLMIKKIRQVRFRKRALMVFRQRPTRNSFGNGGKSKRCFVLTDNVAKSEQLTKKIPICPPIMIF